MTETRDDTLTWLTQEAYDRLKAELDHLSGPGRVEIAKKIEAAREEGDLKENGGYHAAKDEQGKMEARIRHIDRIIRNHEIVEKASSGVIDHASIVTVLYEGDQPGEEQEFFVGSIEEKPDGVLVASPTSPLGAALLGHQVGDVVGYEAPSGELRVTVVAVR